MYKSEWRGSIWVTLARVDWYWMRGAQVVNGVLTNVPFTPSHSKDPKAVNETALPTWTKTWKNSGNSANQSEESNMPHLPELSWELVLLAPIPVMALVFLLQLLKTPESEIVPTFADQREFRPMTILEDGRVAVQIELEFDKGKPVRPNSPLVVDMRVKNNSNDVYMIGFYGMNWRLMAELWRKHGTELIPVELTDDAKEQRREGPYARLHRWNSGLLPNETNEYGCRLRDTIKTLESGDYRLNVRVSLEKLPDHAFWHELLATLEFRIE